MARISSRIGAIAPSATLIVDSKAKALKAAGRPVIGFGAGEPDFPTPAHIVDAAREALNDPKNFRYSPPRVCPNSNRLSRIKPCAIPALRSILLKYLLQTVVSRRSMKPSLP